ncbi:acyl-CoA dehydrogenase family protein [Phenylobacterium sp.]|uniref:acyl-CoA dehydrogenase family protein n=1 Tax=Phenylobacterium sp. TaxID=1871053 RepID=UPI0027348446|nr:acyl-CoA dehydrogenase family protein [Phenylobacterium sp.]MDP3853568.1 acyl-CoA dehydrogenase family protein [Phenylobacterium sp.]
MMDLTFDAADEAFRQEVRAFLAANLPRELAERVRFGKSLGKADFEGWQATLNARGWLAPHWPKAYGGQDWTATQTFIWDYESSLANAPPTIAFGFKMLAPVLIKYGSEEQRRHWLPRMLRGDDWWCQGYSEPGAGSDLAGVKTTAVRQGDHYVINGQKTWTSLAQHANMIFLLARTDSSGKKQEGISFILLDMNQPGVEVRPIITLDGDHEVNEIFFTDARAPVSNLVGDEGGGWTYAKYLLTYERTSMAMVGASSASLELLREIAQRETKGDRPLIEDPYFAARFAKAEIELENLKTTTLRVVAAAAAGGAPGAESSMLKVKGTEVAQEIQALIRRAVGPYAVPFRRDCLEPGANAAPVGPAYAAGVTSTYLNGRKLTIYGGSNEVQRNIITKAILKL